MEKQTVEVNEYWCLEADVSRGFNILKAKLYNLIEATIKEEKQQQAVKGLIKDFANDSYRLVIRDMRFDAINAKMIEKESAEVPETTYPLENSLLM
jgi:hypothetical protein